MKNELDPAVLNEITRRMEAMEAALPEASRLLRDMQNEDLHIKSKTHARDLLTRADLESEKLIVGRIQALFPEDEILAEESGRSDQHERASDFLWIIDPLDGTINYAHGLPLYGVAIGLAHQGRPVAGTVTFPALNDTYRARINGGAFRNKKPIRVSAETDLFKSLVSTGFPYNRHELIDELIAGVESMLKLARGIRRTGAATLDLCWIAEGRFDAYYEMNLAPWDVCAAGLIALEAGAAITDFRGRPFDPFSGRFAASNGKVHERFLEALKPLADALDKKELETKNSL